MTRLPQLPPEIISKILAMSIEEEPVCIFKLFVPDWNLCGNHDHQSELESILHLTRFDTYTVGEDGEEHLLTKFTHNCEDCIYLPTMTDPRGLEIEPSLDRELVKAWAGTSTMVFRQMSWPRLGRFDDPELPAQIKTCPLLRDEAALEIMPQNDSISALVPKRMVPPDPYVTMDAGTRPQYIYERVRHVVLNTDPDLWDRETMEFATRPEDGLRAIPLVTWMLLNNRLVEERAAHLFADWKAMTRLESLFLDMRVFSHDRVSHEVMKGAMRALEGKGLKLLVVAGLRWFEDHCETGGEVEIDSRELDHESSDITQGQWIHALGKAVRPGGKLILVDKAAVWLGNNINMLPYAEGGPVQMARIGILG